MAPERMWLSAEVLPTAVPPSLTSWLRLLPIAPPVLWLFEFEPEPVVLLVTFAAFLLRPKEVLLTRRFEGEPVAVAPPYFYPLLLF